MPNSRGLWHWFCPACKTVTPQRTLNVKVESAGKTKWYPVFRLCTACGAFNPVVYRRYTLSRPPGAIPSRLARSVTDELKGGPLELPQLLSRLRGHPNEGVGHVLKSDVLMVLEYLERAGVVESQEVNRTEDTIGILGRRGPASTHHGPCPEELKRGIASFTLVSLYAQTRRNALPGHPRTFTHRGWLCLNCGYRRIGRAVNPGGASIPTV